MRRIKQMNGLGSEVRVYSQKIARIAAVVLLAGIAIMPVPGRAATDHKLFAFYYTYVSQGGVSTITIAQGDTIDFTNLDLPTVNTYYLNPQVYQQIHQVVEDRANPRFSSPFISTGQSTTVTGVSALLPGTYLFHCTRHPNLKGTLTVA